MSERYQRIMLIRHPQTVANAEMRYIGRSDSPVTPVGEQQAAWVSGVAASWGAGKVFSSPLGRAHDLAQRIAPADADVRVLDDLAEVDFGESRRHRRPASVRRKPGTGGHSCKIRPAVSLEGRLRVPQGLL